MLQKELQEKRKPSVKRREVIIFVVLLMNWNSSYLAMW
jgi:hypothetical protein